mgnify:CR=1 FL=1
MSDRPHSLSGLLLCWVAILRVLGIPFGAISTVDPAIIFECLEMLPDRFPFGLDLGSDVIGCELPSVIREDDLAY